VKIAVTGAFGFIGQELITALLDNDHEIIAVDFIERLKEQDGLPIMPKLYSALPRCEGILDPWDFVSGDFETLGVPDVVIHAGAVVDTTDKWSDRLRDLNLTYTSQISGECSERHVPLIFISSAAVYGEHGAPNNPYGLSKALGEKIVARTAAPTASLRLFNVFGRNEHHKRSMASVAWRLNNAMQTGIPFELFNIDSMRDFVPVSSVVESIMQVAENLNSWDKFDHRVYDVGTGKPVRFMELFQLIATANQKSTQSITFGDMPKEYEGKYQHFTQAGIHGVPNIGNKITTAEGIERIWKNV
jgi:ADP-L-glycero-D-manno-heptose 6-epimerase